jgi:SPP1 family predicted phage head-tail adaptor
MRAGQLRSRLAIQSVTRSGDGGGGAAETWSTVATVWGRVEALNGLEAFRAMQVASAMSHRVTIRRRTVTPQQRILDGSDILQIRAVRPSEKGESVELLCEQVFI